MKTLEYTHDGDKIVIDDSGNRVVELSERVTIVDGKRTIVEEGTDVVFTLEDCGPAWVDEDGNEGRICTECGKLITEGFYFDGDYACDEDCADELFSGRPEMWRDRIEKDFDNNYWTQWS